MSGRSIWGGAALDEGKCMEIATGDRWLSLADDLDPAVKAILDRCYQILRQKAEEA
jgi:hypothetical protein